jgi:hypothetical protein
MKESSITDPALLLDQVVVHDGDMGRRAAEADPPQPEPEPQGFLEGRLLHRSEWFILRHSGGRECDRYGGSKFPQKL